MSNAGDDLYDAIVMKYGRECPFSSELVAWAASICKTSYEEMQRALSEAFAHFTVMQEVLSEREENHQYQDKVRSFLKTISNARHQWKQFQPDLRQLFL